MQTKNILISGGGIAGLTLAHWLREHRFTPTVVERAPAPRTGGQAVDIRGRALDVVERMGVLDRARAKRTRMQGMSMVDGHGKELMRSTKETLSGGRFDSPDVEIMREDLTRILLDAAAEGVEYCYDDSVVAVEDTGAGVRVTFERSAPRTFDLMVGADGLHSAVRRLVFGPEREYLHHLGMYVGIFTSPNFLGMTDWQIWLREGHAGLCVMTTPDNTKLQTYIGFESAPIDRDHRDIEGAKHLVSDAFAGIGWEVPRLLKAMHEAPNFYFDAVAQIRMDAWTRGRVALLGDAGYCASLVTGQGTSLALIGAYVLAAELAAARDNYTAAFAAYEKRMRPFVTANQRLVPERPEGPPDPESVLKAAVAIELP